MCLHVAHPGPSYWIHCLCRPFHSFHSPAALVKGVRPSFPSVDAASSFTPLSWPSRDWLGCSIGLLCNPYPHLCFIPTHHPLSACCPVAGPDHFSSLFRGPIALPVPASTLAPQSLLLGSTRPRGKCQLEMAGNKKPATPDLNLSPVTVPSEPLQLWAQWKSYSLW